MILHIYPTPGEVISNMAVFITNAVNDAIEKKGHCHLVLTGGNSPKDLYALLASPAYNEVVKWDKVFFYFGDERYVPFNHKDNNGRMVKEVFFDPLGIRDDHIFYMDTSFTPEMSAQNYDEALRKNLGGSYPVFDLILLGLGDNSHTASLFPRTPVLQEKTAGVKAVHLADPDSFRITMTAPMINEAKSIAFLVFGRAKAEAVYHVLKGDRDIELYPAQLINSFKASTHWFLDQEAAGLVR